MNIWEKDEVINDTIIIFNNDKDDLNNTQHTETKESNQDNDDNITE